MKVTEPGWGRRYVPDPEQFVFLSELEATFNQCSTVSMCKQMRESQVGSGGAGC